MGKSSTPPIRAVIYARVSLDATGEHLAVERQREDCEKLAQRRGWTVTRVYVDNSVSASKRNVKRPAYNEMVRDFEAGKFDAIVCYDLDRLTRQPKQLEDWIDRAETTGLVVVTSTGEADLGTDAGRLFARIKASVARSEVERMSARRRRANLQAAEAGRPAMSGLRPFGYTRAREIVPEEAELIRDGYRQVLAGVSLMAIARSWTAAGTTTTQGRTWGTANVRMVLSAPRNAALRDYKGEVIAKGTWEPVVDEETWRAARSLMLDPSRRTAQDTSTRFLLGNIARCGRCGGIMVTSRNRQGVRSYKCRAHNHVSVMADVIDQVVEGVVVGRLSQPDVASLLRPEERVNMDALRDRGNVLRARMDEGAHLFAEGTITGAQLARINRDVQRDLDENENRLVEASRHSVIAQFVSREDVAALWESLDILVQREVVTTLFEAVTITPPGRGRKTSPDNVELTWRGAK